MEKIISLNELTEKCGFFNTDTIVNNGYGCSNPECGDRDLMVKVNGGYDYVKSYNEVGFIAIRMSKRKIRFNRRLAKKFVKKARLIQRNNDKLKKYGLFQAGKCFYFSCPIAYEVSFDSFKDYENYNEYDYIEKEEDMPQGFGDELMAVDPELINA